MELNFYQLILEEVNPMLAVPQFNRLATLDIMPISPFLRKTYTSSQVPLYLTINICIINLKTLSLI